MLTAARRRIARHATPVLGPSGRRRVNFRFGVDRADASHPQQAHVVQESPPEPRELSHFHGAVLVLPDLANGALTTHDRVVIAAARDLADQFERPLLMLAFEPVVSRLQPLGVDALINLERDAAPMGAQRFAAAQSVAEAVQTPCVVAPDGYGAGADAARRLAASRQEMPNLGAVAFEGHWALCRTNNPLFESRSPLASVVLVAPSYLARLHPPTGAAHPVQPPPLAVPPDLQDLGSFSPDPGTVELAQAEFIISAGAGVTDWPLFQQVVAMLGATPAASRVVVDAGHMPFSRQVGASGTSVAARVYLAFGVSGAVQHLEGITHCQHVISVNSDEACAMTGRAELNFVNDCHAVMRALLVSLERVTP